MSTAASPQRSEALAPARPVVVVMGVSGTGKSTVAVGIAAALGVACVEGDRLHAPASIEKMRTGIPLTSEDRWPWLDRIAERLADPQGVVASCSALRRDYRDRLRAGAPRLRFIFLDGPADLIRERMLQRTDHYMRPELLESQFATLEKPGADEPDVTTLDISIDVQAVVDEAVRALAVPHPAASLRPAACGSGRGDAATPLRRPPEVEKPTR